MLKEGLTANATEWDFGRLPSGESDAGHRSSSAHADAASDNITLSFYDNEIPHFAGPALERLYNNLYASLDQLTLNGRAAGTSTCVLMRAGKLAHVFLFRREQGAVRVLNQSMWIGQADIDRFSRAVFSRYDDAAIIRFHAVQSDLQRLAFPWQWFHCAQEIVAELPPTREDYLAGLGKNMREQVKRYTNKIRRTFPSFSFEVHTGEDIDEATIAELYRLHRERIISKNDVPHIDEAGYREVVALAQKCGLVTVARIDGHICGGLICFRTGSRYQMRIIAHDLKYDAYKMGTVCCYHTIGECIDRGAKTFDFMSGRMLYKFRFLGVERDFYQLTIYRSGRHQLMHLPYAVRTAGAGTMREFRMWMQDADQRDDRASRLTAAVLAAWRRLKQCRKSLLVAKERDKPAGAVPWAGTGGDERT